MRSTVRKSERQCGFVGSGLTIFQSGEGRAVVDLGQIRAINPRLYAARQ
jgi:hypothetical protein